MADEDQIGPDIDPATGRPILSTPTPEGPPTIEQAKAMRPLASDYGSQDMAKMFAQKASDATAAAAAKAGSVAQSFKDAMARRMLEANKDYMQLRADHPEVNWAAKVIEGVPLTAAGPFGMAAAGLTPGPKLPSPTGATNVARPSPGQVTSPGGQFRRPIATPYDMPDAGQAQASQRPILGGGIGAIGAAGDNLGTDASLKAAQRAQIEGQQALIDKRTEEAGNRVGALDFASSAQSSGAQMRAIFAQAQRQADEDVAKEQKDYDTQIQNATEAASKMGVDPGRVFHQKDSGFMVAALIGGLFSGFLSGKTGRPDTFMPMLERIVDRDIEAQNKSIDQAWKKVGGMQTTYQRLVNRGVDKKLAQHTYYDQVLGSIQDELKARLAKASLPAEKANIEAGLQEIENQRKQMVTSLNEYWAKIGGQRRSEASAIAERQWNHQVQMYELAQKDRALSISQQEADAKLAVSGGSMSREEMSRLQERLNAQSEALETLHQIQQVMSRGGTLSPEQRGRGEALLGLAAHKMAKAEVGGSRPPNKEEVELQKEMLTGGDNPASYQFTSKNAGRLSTTRAALLRDMNRSRIALGMEPLPDDYNPLPTVAETVPGVVKR